MRDTQLYQQLLGLAQPWSVTRVELSVAAARVDVWVEHPRRSRFGCPECGAQLFVHDHAEERVWRHLHSCQFLTYLHTRPATGGLPGAWGTAGAPAVGRADVAVHHPVRAAGHRRAAGL